MRRLLVLLLVCALGCAWADQEAVMQAPASCTDSFPKHGSSKALDPKFQVTEVTYWTVDNKTDFDAVIVARLKDNDIAEVYVQRNSKAIYTIPFEYFSFQVFTGTVWCGRDKGFLNANPAVRTSRPSSLNNKVNHPMTTNIFLKGKTVTATTRFEQP